MEPDKNEIRVEVSGKFACFTRPDLKVERVTYDIITPSAARNIIQAIYWHPGVDYEITEIELLNPIKKIQMVRNELKSKIKAVTIISNGKKEKNLSIDRAEDIMQRSSIILKDVKYCIHFLIHQNEQANPGDTVKKYKEIFLRRARLGQCYTQPYLGLKEFSANVKLLSKSDDVRRLHSDNDLGLMLYDLDYRNKENITPTYFFAKLDDGKLDLRNIKIYR